LQWSTKIDATDYCSLRADLIDEELDPAADVPNQVLTTIETGDRAAVEQGVGRTVQHIDTLYTSTAIPVHAVERNRMSLAVSEVNIDGEERARFPPGGDAIVQVHLLERALIRSRRGPG